MKYPPHALIFYHTEHGAEVEMGGEASRAYFLTMFMLEALPAPIFARVWDVDQDDFIAVAPEDIDWEMGNGPTLSGAAAASDRVATDRLNRGGR